MPALADLSKTYGPLCISTFIAAIFYGITIAQAYFYYSTFGSDPRTVKGYAAFLLIFDTMTIALAMHGTYWYLALHWGDVSILEVMPTPFYLEAVFAYTTILVGQLFFIHRIHILTSSRLLTATLLIFSAAGFGTALVIASVVAKLQSWDSSTLVLMENLVIANKVLATATDGAITLALCVTLSRKQTTGRKMKSKLKWLIVFAINRGALAAVLQLVYMIMFIVLPTELIWLTFHIILSKVYTNSVLAVLNSRAATRATNEGIEYFSTMDFTPPARSSANARQTTLQLTTEQSTTFEAEHGARIDIHIKREKISDGDPPYLSTQ